MLLLLLNTVGAPAPRKKLGKVNSCIFGYHRGWRLHKRPFLSARWPGTFYYQWRVAGNSSVLTFGRLATWRTTFSFSFCAPLPPYFLFLLLLCIQSCTGKMQLSVALQDGNVRHFSGGQRLTKRRFSFVRVDIFPEGKGPRKKLSNHANGKRLFCRTFIIGLTLKVPIQLVPVFVSLNVDTISVYRCSEKQFSGSFSYPW